MLRTPTRVKPLDVGDAVQVVIGVHASREGIVRTRNETRLGAVLGIAPQVSLAEDIVVDGFHFYVDATKCILKK